MWGRPAPGLLPSIPPRSPFTEPGEARPEVGNLGRVRRVRLAGRQGPGGRHLESEAGGRQGGGVPGPLPGPAPSLPSAAWPAPVRSAARLSEAEGPPAAGSGGALGGRGAGRTGRAGAGREGAGDPRLSDAPGGTPAPIQTRGGRPGASYRCVRTCAQGGPFPAPGPAGRAGPPRCAQTSGAAICVPS